MAAAFLAAACLAGADDVGGGRHEGEVKVGVFLIGFASILTKIANGFVSGFLAKTHLKRSQVEFGVGDPAGAGVAKSLDHPGMNVSGSVGYIDPPKLFPQLVKVKPRSSSLDRPTIGPDADALAGLPAIAQSPPAVIRQLQGEHAVNSFVTPGVSRT